MTSRTLSPVELQQLSRPRGFMPDVSEFAPVELPMAKIQEHVRKLDIELRQHVQGVCERFPRERKLPGYGTACASVGQLLRRYFRLGTVREIWPEILFYLFFCVCLQVYAAYYGWEFKWSAVIQDTMYYPALVTSFLLSLRTSDCMYRYRAGCECVFEMERHLRELAFHVLTTVSLNEGSKGPASSIRKRYFRHEFRRLMQVLFVCAVRDLNDSALGGQELALEDAMRLRCSLTDVEHSAIHVTNALHGHTFRVGLATAWLEKLVLVAQKHKIFDTGNVHAATTDRLNKFTQAWMMARQVAYSSMPGSIIHLLWVMVSMLNIILLWEYVSVCRWMTWLPSVIISVAFFSLVQIAANMENPFGFDKDDIPVWKVVADLDDEVALFTFYAALDEVAGENVYRGLSALDKIYVAGG